MYQVQRVALVLVATLASASVAHAQQTILFDTDPFFGSDALTTPGRQVVGAELFTTFNPATDAFSFDAGVFGGYGIGSINFISGVIGALPTSGFNVIVLQTFDNDADISTPFTAGHAAGLLAEHITSSGAGFFLYFNSVLNVPRLVFSTDLSDNQADLKVLARLTNLSGQDGQVALSSFTAANFDLAATTVPEPSSILLVASGLILIGARWRMQ